jgi:hypothetical protein
MILVYFYIQGGPFSLFKAVKFHFNASVIASGCA